MKNQLSIRVKERSPSTNTDGERDCSEEGEDFLSSIDMNQDNFRQSLSISLKNNQFRAFLLNLKYSQEWRLSQEFVEQESDAEFTVYDHSEPNFNPTS